MSEKDQQRFRHYEKLMRAARKEKFENVPASCGKCPYFQPEFRYRKCLFARCPYGRQAELFRERPLGREKVALTQDKVKENG